MKRLRLFNYTGLFKQLISRDIKLKYRRSVLGYLWTILNPLLTMIVLTIVFSNFFKFTIDNYPIYLLSGQIIFALFSASTNSSCYTLLENATLIKKTYVPKYIFVLSKITSGFIDFLFSIISLIFVMIITHSKFSFYNLLIIIPAIEVYFFSIGVGLFLSQANLFFRDVGYIYSVFITVVNYLTPVFYPLEILPENVKLFVTRWNPLYNYVTLFRQAVYLNVMLDWKMVLNGVIWACGSLIIGGFIFYRKQDKFILYI